MIGLRKFRPEGVKAISYKGRFLQSSFYRRLSVETINDNVRLS